LERVPTQVPQKQGADQERDIHQRVRAGKRDSHREIEAENQDKDNRDHHAENGQRFTHECETQNCKTQPVK